MDHLGWQPLTRMLSSCPLLLSMTRAASNSWPASIVSGISIRVVTLPGRTVVVTVGIVGGWIVVGGGEAGFGVPVDDAFV